MTFSYLPSDEEPAGEPRYCPACGSELLGNDKVAYDDGSWDCHCPVCGWSGDINPFGYED